ncbi:MAG: ATP-binding protein [Candidatus Bathyarchaeota archaeon]|nr:ATP-binding protein [Candidatus Bathyarchaeota archaeon]
MKLRKQMLLLLAFFTVIGTVGMWSFTNRALKIGFEEMEMSILEGTVLWGVDDIIDLALIVDSSVAPIAAWDDMYEYVESRDPAFVEETFSDNVFSRNEFNLVAIYSETGELIYGKYYDYNGETEKNIPPLLREPSTIETLRDYTPEEPSIIGFIINEDKPIILSSRPIVDTAEVMPSRGTIVVGLDFSEDYVDMIQEITDLPLEYYTFDSSEVPEEIRSSLTLENPFTYETELETIRGYYLVEDLFGDPGIIVAISQTREVYLAGQEARREFLSVIIGLGFLLAVLAIVYADQKILRNITRLTDEVSEINKVDDLSARVHVVTGNNELSSLTHRVNDMLEKLEESRETEIRQRAAMEKLREESTLEIFEAAKKISYLIHNELERPLRSIKQVAYSIREEGKEDLAEILESSIKYSEATLLELSSLTNLGEPKRTVSDLNEIVDAAIANVAPKVGVTISADTGEEFLAINVDALKIIRTVENLIRNGVEAIDGRGEVHVAVTSDEKSATVTITDNGKGILEEDLEYIFEPFYSTKRDAVGLGLPYAKQVIEAHNGMIKVESSSEGTTVTIIIPLKQASE